MHVLFKHNFSAQKFFNIYITSFHTNEKHVFSVQSLYWSCTWRRRDKRFILLCLFLFLSCTWWYREIKALLCFFPFPSSLTQSFSSLLPLLCAFSGREIQCPHDGLCLSLCTATSEALNMWSAPSCGGSQTVYYLTALVLSVSAFIGLFAVCHYAEGWILA